MIYKPELSNIGCQIPEDTKVHSHVWIGKEAVIGHRCKIQAFAFIPDGVTLEDDVFIGPNVTFTNDKYPPSGGRAWGTITVKRGASIGAGAIILPGIVIGEYAKIGAGSVVTKNVPPNEVWLGNPAHQFVKKNVNLQ